VYASPQISRKRLKNLEGGEKEKEARTKDRDAYLSATKEH